MTVKSGGVISAFTGKKLRERNPWWGEEDLLSVFINTTVRGLFINQLIALHIANEGKRSKAYGAKLKKMGLRAGSPDWLFVEPFTSRVFFIELKSKNGKQTKSQEDFEADCVVAFVPYKVCDCEKSILDTLSGWGLLKVEF